MDFLPVLFIAYAAPDACSQSEPKVRVKNYQYQKRQIERERENASLYLRQLRAERRGNGLKVELSTSVVDRHLPALAAVLRIRIALHFVKQKKRSTFFFRVYFYFLCKRPHVPDCKNHLM